jgi:hypothetical protein
VVKAFDSNFPSTILGIKSIRGQEFESLGRRHRFCFCSPDGGEWGGRDGSQVFWLGKDGVVRLARSGGGKHNWTWIEACFCV